MTDECVTDVTLRRLSSGGLSHDEKRAICLRGPDHTLLAVSEESEVGGKRLKKTFMESWFERFPWMTTSREKETMLCFPCLLFGEEVSVWRSTGISRLKKFTERAAKHASSQRHIESVFSMKVFMKKEPVDKWLDPGVADEIARHNKEVNCNRACLRRLTDIVTFLGVHGVRQDRYNRENYVDLLTCTTSIDESMKSFFDKNELFQGSSMAMVESDLLKSIVDVLKKRIIREIENSSYVSIQVDQAVDVMDSECASVVMRYALEGKPVERFLGFFAVHQRDAGGIAAVISQAVIAYQCDPKKIVSISCDGACLMKCSVNSLTERVKEWNSSLFFVHSHSHKLSRVIADTVECIPAVRRFFSFLGGFRSFFRRSPKRLDMLEHFLMKETGLRRPVDESPQSRWSFGSRTVTSILKFHAALRSCLSYISSSDRFRDETPHLTEGLLDSLNDFNFIFLCSLWERIFQIIETLSELYQRVENNLAECILLLDRCIENLKDMKADGSFLELLSMAESLTNHKEDSKEHLQISVSKVSSLFHLCIDEVIISLRERFTNLDNLKSVDLFRVQNFRQFNQSSIPNNLIGGISTSHVSKERLKSELQTLYRNQQLSDSEISTSTLYSIIARDFSDVLSECYKLLTIFVTTPASSCSCKRSSSALKRIKKYLHSSPSEERHRSVAMLTIESDFLVKQKMDNVENWYNDIISGFCKVSKRANDFIFR